MDPFDKAAFIVFSIVLSAVPILAIGMAVEAALKASC